MDADESEAYQHLEHDLGFNLSSITARTRPDSSRYIHCKLPCLASIPSSWLDEEYREEESKRLMYSVIVELAKIYN